MSTNPGKPLALVTGACGGIGKATVERLLAGGMRVLALDLSEQALAALVADKNKDPDLIAVPCDLAKPKQLPALAAELVRKHGAVTRLVNNAGIWKLHPLTEMPDEVWDVQYDVNVKAPFILIRELAPAMARAGGGAIVNVASRNAIRSSVNNCAYDSSKAALAALTRTAAGELARYNIRVNTVSPGVILSPPNQELKEDKLFYEAYTRQIPLARFGEPREIASVIAFLLSGDASFVTGQDIIVDGGQIACQDNKRYMEIPYLAAQFGPAATPATT